jgi:hypothetical protein
MNSRRLVQSSVAAVVAAISPLLLPACDVMHIGSPDRGKDSALGRYCDLSREDAVEVVRAVVRWERCAVSWGSLEDECFRVRGDRGSQWHDEILQICIQPTSDRGTLVVFEGGNAPVCMVQAFADRLDQTIELVRSHQPLPVCPPPQPGSSTTDG